MSNILTLIDVKNYDIYNKFNRKKQVFKMIGQRLKKLREEKGLKQADVAKVLGVSRTTAYELAVFQNNCSNFLKKNNPPH